MTVKKSDSFAWLAAGANPYMTSDLDNALGGSGSNKWGQPYSGNVVGAPGGGAVGAPSGQTNPCIGAMSVSLSGLTRRWRVKCKRNGGRDAVVVFGGAQDGSLHPSTTFEAKLTAGHTQLQIKINYWTGSNTTITPPAADEFWLDLTFYNDQLVARVMATDGDAEGLTGTVLGSTALAGTPGTRTMMLGTASGIGFESDSGSTDPLSLMWLDYVASDMATGTAPTLSATSAANTGRYSGQINFTTNDAAGYVSYIVKTTNVAPTEWEMYSAPTKTISAAGAQTISVTGLSAGTPYYVFLRHEGPTYAMSAAAAVGSFTTAAAMAAPIISSVSSSVLNRKVTVVVTMDGASGPVTGVTVTLPAGSPAEGAITQAQKPAVFVSGSTWQAIFNDVPFGNYAAANATASNADANHTMSDTEGFNLFDLEGTPAPSGVDNAPFLTGQTATATSNSTATGSVTTNEANGTLYLLIDTIATASAAAVKAGASQAVTTTGVQSFSFTGLSPSTTYFAHFLHRDAAGNDSAVANSSAFATPASADVTPPTLTSPTGASTSASTASGAVSTDEGSGTLYTLASVNATESVASVKSGATQSVSSAGVQTVAVTGLMSSTTYYLHYVHRDLAGNDSDAANSASFTTPAGADTTKPILSSPTGVATGITTATGTVSTNEANGTLYYRATGNATESAATVKAGATQVITTVGVKSFSVSGLSASTGYYMHTLQRDNAGNDSDVVNSALFTTQAVPVVPVIPVDPAISAHVSYAAWYFNLRKRCSA